MATKITDKRGLSQGLQNIPVKPSSSPLPASTAATDSKIIQANADGSIKEPPPAPEVLLLTPFPDGTCLKMVPRPWPGKLEDKPANYDADPQFVLVNVAKQQLAVVRNGQVAHLICDSVNILFAAQEEADRMGRQVEQEAEHLTNSIVKANFQKGQ